MQVAAMALSEGAHEGAVVGVYGGGGHALGFSHCGTPSLGRGGCARRRMGPPGYRGGPTGFPLAAIPIRMCTTTGYRAGGREWRPAHPSSIRDEAFFVG